MCFNFFKKLIFVLLTIFASLYAIAHPPSSCPGYVKPKPPISTNSVDPYSNDNSFEKRIRSALKGAVPVTLNCRY